MDPQPSPQADFSVPSIQTPASMQPEPLPPKKAKRWPLVLLVIILVAVIGDLGYVLVHDKTSTTNKTASLTLYYSDGKTLLWKSGMPQTGGASDYIRLVQAELRSRYGTTLNDGDWSVTTSLDSTMQQTAEAELSRQQATFTANNLNDGSVIATSAKTGQIVVWASQGSGNTDLLTTNVSVGSLALPLTFAATIQKTPNTTAATTYSDVQMPLSGYPCTNSNSSAENNCLYDFDRQYLGSVTLAQVLGDLRLMPAELAAQAAGLVSSDGSTTAAQQFDDNLANQTKAFACHAINSSLQANVYAPCYTAALIGNGLFANPKDIVAAYTTLANKGKRLPQTSFTRVIHDGKNLYTWQQPTTEQVIPASDAQLVTTALADSSTSILQQKSAFMINNQPVSVANGVTSLGVYGSTIAYTSNYVIGAWVYGGNNSSLTYNNSEQFTLPVAEAPLQVVH